MKKYLLLTLFSIFFLSFLQGQNLVFVDGNHQSVSGDTVVVTGLDTLNFMAAHFKVTNQGGASIDVKIARREIDIVPGTSNNFCWIVCYPPATDTSTKKETIAPGDTSFASLDCDYYPAGNSGSSLIAYTAFDENNLSDTAIVYVRFNVLHLGIETHNYNYNISLYPNPANLQTTFNYDLNGAEGYVKIFNVVGNEIAKHVLKDNKFTLNTEKFQSGIYFYSIVINGKKQKTNRLIIVH